MKRNTTYMLAGAFLIFFCSLGGNAYAKKKSKSNSTSPPAAQEVAPPPFVTNSVKANEKGNSTNSSSGSGVSTKNTTVSTTTIKTSTTTSSTSSSEPKSTTTTTKTTTTSSGSTNTATTTSSASSKGSTSTTERAVPTTITTASGTRVTSVNDKIKVDYNGKCLFVGENAQVEFYLTNNSGKIIEEFYIVGSCSADETKAYDDNGNEYVVNVKFGNSGGNCYIADSPLLKATPVKVVLTIEKANRKNMNYFSKITIAGRTSVYAYNPPRNEYQGVFILENVVPKKDQ